MGGGGIGLRRANIAPSPPIFVRYSRFPPCGFPRYRNLGGRGGRRTKSAIRNQVRIATSGSLLPLWEKARMRVRRAQARLRLCGRDARAPRVANLPMQAIHGKMARVMTPKRNSAGIRPASRPTRTRTPAEPSTPVIPAKAGIHRAGGRRYDRPRERNANAP